MCEIGEPTGPIENGTTYIVRPRIDPAKSLSSTPRISAGSLQLLVGPASPSFCEQMKVRSSTRATSDGLEWARYELGRLASESFSNVPPSTSCWARESYSSDEPSHQWIESGWVSSAISSTQEISWACLVGASVGALVSLTGCVQLLGRVAIDAKYRPSLPAVMLMRTRRGWVRPRLSPGAGRS